LNGLEKGKLSVGTSFTAGSSFVPIAVPAFKKEFPGINLIFKIDRTESLEEKLLDGKIDVGILSRAPNSSLLLAKPHRKEKIVIFAPVNHPLANRRSVSMQLLAKEQFVIANGSMNRGMIERAFAQKGLPLNIVLEIDVHYGSREAVKTAVASGVGIGQSLLCQVTDEVLAGRLAVLNVPELNLHRTIHITVHKSRETSSLVQAFIEFLEGYKN